VNPERFLEQFGHLAEAPNGIAKRRELILQLAVRGKLVPQDPNDEPASVLLEKIRAEKERLVAARKLNKTERLAAVMPDAVPFELPRGWEWIRLGSITLKIGSGSTPRGGKNAYVDTGIVFLRSQNIWNEGLRLEDVAFITDETHEKMTNTHVTASDVLLNITGASLGRCALVPEDLGPANVSQHVTIITSAFDSFRPYLHKCLLSPFVQNMVWGRQVGMAREGLSKRVLEQFEIPFPPLAEQSRIVAKVDQLMALCDELEAKRNRRTETHGRLVRAAHHPLTQPRDRTELDTAWRRVRDNFDRLHATIDSIKAVRQTILQLAVQGKLVPQDPDDEPVSELLERIPMPAKPSRYKKRTHEVIPGDCGLSINMPDMPVPVGWNWTPLIDIARLESGHTPSRNQPDYWGGEIPWVGIVDARMHDSGIIQDTFQHTNEVGLANSAARLLPTGTVCVSRTASVGYVIVMGRPMATSQDFVNWVPTKAVSSEWIQLVMIAERPIFRRFSKGAVHQTIYYPAWLSMHIALPPIREQHRIVAKVDQLMTLCDELEAKIQGNASCAQRFAEAVVAELAA